VRLVLAPTPPLSCPFPAALAPCSARANHSDPRSPVVRLACVADKTGRLTEMMKVAGLLPVSFRGVHYNIPVCVWIPQQYPTIPPIPFVQPSPDMDLVRGHQHMDVEDGMCYFPYCNEWTVHANVSGLLDVMVAAFSAHPPVTAKQTMDERQQLEQRLASVRRQMDRP
jgi:ESCRT-I complex subunit TSG101